VTDVGVRRVGRGSVSECRRVRYGSCNISRMGEKKDRIAQKNIAQATWVSSPPTVKQGRTEIGKPEMVKNLKWTLEMRRRDRQGGFFRRKKGLTSSCPTG